jgi:hypothetical protein
VCRSPKTERREFEFGADNNQRKLYRRVTDEPLKQIAEIKKTQASFAHKVTATLESHEKKLDQNTSITLQTKASIDQLAGLIELYIQAKQVGKAIGYFWRFINWLRGHLVSLLKLFALCAGAIALYKGGSNWETIWNFLNK